MYARSVDADQSGVKNTALVTELLHTLIQSSAVTDEAASKFGDAVRCHDMLGEQALTVERVFKALRAHFEGLAQIHDGLAEHLPPEEAARLQAALAELRGRLGLAAGALRRWNLGVQTCADTARQASTMITSVRTSLAEAAAAAEELVIFEG